MFRGKTGPCVRRVTVSTETGKQIPAEEKNEDVGGGANPAAVWKGVLVKGGLVARNKSFLSSREEGFVRRCQKPAEGGRGGPRGTWRRARGLVWAASAAGFADRVSARPVSITRACGGFGSHGPWGLRLRVTLQLGDSVLPRRSDPVRGPSGRHPPRGESPTARRWAQRGISPLWLSRCGVGE